MTLIAAALAGCGSSSKAAGSVGGACFSNGTCDTGLECLSNLCVQPAGAGGTGGAAAGAGGHAAGGAGGAGGQAAAGTNGSAGAGGACTLLPDTFTGASTDCQTCLAKYCCEQFNACEMDDNCSPYIDVVGATSADGTVIPLQTCASTNCPGLCPSRIEGS